MRSKVQVELSATDCRTLGIGRGRLIFPGNLSGAGDVIIIGPAGILKADGSVIIAKSHIHMTPADASVYGVRDGQAVSVRIESGRPLTLEEVIIRVSEKYALAMHIDFDEANAAMAGKNVFGTIRRGSGSRTGTCVQGKEAQPVCPKVVRLTGKKLITEADAYEAASDCGEVHIQSGVIITPSARDVFTSRHIKIVID